MSWTKYFILTRDTRSTLSIQAHYLTKQFHFRRTKFSSPWQISSRLSSKTAWRCTLSWTKFLSLLSDIVLPDRVAEERKNLMFSNMYNISILLVHNPVGKIAEKAVWSSVFLTIWHCVLSAELTICPLGRKHLEIYHLLNPNPFIRNSKVAEFLARLAQEFN